MSDLDATTPRVFLVRHGETEWTKTGQYTGTTDIELTAKGVQQIKATAKQLVGPGKLIDLTYITETWISPRKRALDTFRHLVSRYGDGFQPPNVRTVEDLAEWDYGEYEGLLVADIRTRRKEKGLDQDRAWNIWRDGCEGGESQQEVTTRLDRLIAQIRELQAPAMNGEKPADVLLVAHGLILRVFVKRWLGLAADNSLSLMLPPGGVGLLSYKNHSVDEPALLVGMALPSED